jgi:hypothetical protein
MKTTKLGSWKIYIEEIKPYFILNNNYEFTFMFKVAKYQNIIYKGRKVVTTYSITTPIFILFCQKIEERLKLL